VSLFVDTSAFYALLDRDDRFHEDAKTVWLDELEEETSLLTHNYIVLETHALLQSRIGLDAARVFEDDLLAPVRVLWVDEPLHIQATEAHLSADKRQISLVDRISLLLMRKRGLSTAFCFDEDFSKHGFDVRP